MKKSKIILTIMTFLLIFMTAFISNKVQATPLNPNLYFGIAGLRTTTNMGYAMGDPDSGAEKIWKIVQYSNTNFNDPTEVSAYCIKANTGFTDEGSTDVYDVSYNMKTERGAIAKQNDILNHLVNDGQYDNLLALADILYVKDVSTQAERQQLLDASGANDVVEKSDFNGVADYYITDDEIDAVQQAAIWYFTNYEDSNRYDKYGETSWIWYTTEMNKGEYENFSSYNPTGIPYASATAGYYRQQQMVKLYDYLVETAKENASEGINDEKTILTVYASNEDSEAQPIMEVIKLPRTFDLSLRKYITAVNDETIANTRVPVVDESTLKTGTTATYKHRKDPVEVKTNDTITYNITIYNEGEKAGRATKVVDQLPTGLEFIEVVSGNFQEENYDEETNTIYLTRKANNTKNLSAYEAGTLSSETIQIKCKVTATGGQSDKVLTNIAWIAEEIDEDGKVITNEPGDDRDSEPSTITTQTKDELVTIDNGYIGNSNNSGKDLTNTESYFEGQQDDDDFEKVIVRAVTSVEVSKVWEDNSNQDGIRATEIKVELLKNEQATGQFITLNEGNKWSGKFDNLPTKENGQDITYSVKEITTINGYTTNTNATTDSTGKSYTITNSHTPETTSVSVNKVWDDNNNQDGIRAPEIEVALKKGTQTLQTVKLDKNNDWKHIFAGLAKYENGQEIEYTVEEIKVPDGYTENIEETTNNNFTITNTHIPEVTSITAKKEWYYFNNRENVKPEYVEFELYKNGQATGTIKRLTAPTWTVTFDNLPVKENGQEIEYTVREVNVPNGYQPIGGSLSKGYSIVEQGIQTQANEITDETIDGTKENGYTITNVYYPFDLSLRKYITKVGDTDITDRIPNIDINPLLEGYIENGDETTAHYKHKKNPVTVKTGDKVIYNLTVYNEGLKAGMATKIEDQLPTGLKFERVISDDYEVESYSESDNLLKLKLIDVNTNSITPDFSNYDYLLEPITSSDGVNYHLDSITIQIECTVTAEAGSENQILTNVAWISEAYDVVDGVTITTQEHADTDSEPGTKPNVNKDDLVTTDDGYIGNENNNGKDLSDSEEYFEGEQDDDDFEKIVIEAQTQVTVNKVWNDNNNQDGIRPPEIQVELLKNDEETGKSVVLNAENNWTDIFDNLPVYEDGQKITYTVKEVIVDGYDVQITSNGENNFTITNTYTPEVTSITAHKVWSDYDDRDGIRPDSVKFELYKNGEATGTIKELTVPTWTVTFDNLPVKENGQEIVYTVREVNVPDGYFPIGGGIIPARVVDGLEEYEAYGEGTNTVEGTKENNYIITNVHLPFDLSLRKYITKVGDTDITDRIPNIDVNPLLEGYMGNGDETTAHYKHKKDPVTVKTGDKVIYNLTVYNEGLKAGMATKIEDQLPTGLKFERVISDDYEVESYSESDNLLKLKLIDVNTNLTTPDFSNYDYLLEPITSSDGVNYHLDSITIQIECTVTAEAGNENQILTNVAWISEAYDVVDGVTITTQEHADTDSEPGTKPNVNKDDLVTTDDGYIGNENNNGKDLSDSEEYFEGEQDDDDFEKIVIEARTEITVTKQWIDNDNQDGFRPSELKIELYKKVGNGAEEFVRDATMTGTGNTWAGRFIDLPVYENGQKITYIVREVNENGNLDAYTSSGDATEANQYTLTNTHTSELTSVSVNKVWNDNNNQDAIRPPDIQVQLVKEVGGEKTEVEGKIITLSDDNQWRGTFDNLPVYENGQKITYSVKEITISGYAVNITQNSENNFTITNTHTPGVTSVNINKVWDDQNNQDGIRPESVEIELLKNGEPTGNIITLSEENNWTGTFNNLPIKENGEDIEYTVRENTQIEGYTTEITENTETASNANNTQNLANAEEPEITTQTYAAKDMVRAAVVTVEPKSFRITNTHLVEEAFDLSLRKFIVAVSEDETIEENDILMNENGSTYEREPVVDASKLNTSDEDGNMITTAIYHHTKEPVLVKKNDIVVYMLRVYNEGEQDGYAAEIKDYLPSYLTFVDGEYNAQYGWEVSEDGRTVTTRYLENSVIAKPQTDESGNNTLSYVQVPIMCRVSDSVNANENITNIADITEYQDKDKQPVEDRDSQEENVQLPTDEELPGYKNEESENSYVPGQEDDDDFEKVYVEEDKEFDLALRKFISEVDGTQYNRVPNVDLSGLESGTTAIYNHTKDPVLVKRNSVIIYTIRVYNEGDISGYAEKVTDYLPEGLEFLPDHEINLQYEWQVSEDGRYVTTDYLSSGKETEERQNEIQAFDGQTLDYKEVQIACQVKDNVGTNVKLTNLAEITEDSDEDRDSTPDNIEIPGNEELPSYKDDEIEKDYVPGQEDDDDFEKVIVQDFDLALRKFITKVDEGDVTTRVPEVSYDREEDQITYNHAKDPVEVITGNVVEYTIRVYNEGDIAGYAEEIADDIPDGLRYLPKNETNIAYRWVMYDENGNVTENSEEAVEIRTDYLSKEQGENRQNGSIQEGTASEENPNLLQAFNGEEEIGEGNPDYRDLKVAFEVIEPNTSDRIIVNSAQVTEDSDENGNPVEDIDSIPDEWNDGEDDQDREYIKLTYFDLALRKWVTQAIVIENGKETITQTGHTAEMNPEPVVKVELYRKKVNQVTVKFRYSIRITNEGDIAGYATEITDYIPEGLRFVAEDNPGWADEGNNIISTRALENTLLQPGESAEVEVVLTWINGEDNMGQMTNIAEISEDYNDKGAPDRDSIPDNQKSGEDDIDDAPVLLTVGTGQERIYYVLGFTVLGTLAGGLVLMKKFVI